MKLRNVNSNAHHKKSKLVQNLKEQSDIIVAFSGGVDSTFLLKVAYEAGVNVVAVTIKAEVFPDDETDFAKEFCEELGIQHIIVDADLLSDDEFIANKVDRCYTCKKFLFGNLTNISEELGIPTVCDGSIADDEDDYRPGKKAIKELGILSPLAEVELTKEEIRILSKEMNLPTWDKPSMACLASRFPYGNKIEKEKLKMVEKAEKYLRELGFDQVRVRIHDDMARIEVLPSNFDKLMEEGKAKSINDELIGMGFSYVSLDLKGYRTGSLNENIEKK